VINSNQNNVYGAVIMAETSWDYYIFSPEDDTHFTIPR